jgi:hypothetical protein
MRGDAVIVNENGILKVKVNREIISTIIGVCDRTILLSSKSVGGAALQPSHNERWKFIQRCPKPVSMTADG